ncbi:MAG: hypothetical protein LBS48_00405 [Treponema sp.]|jgi:tetratricopeptide (TPR) repeat protein|nr:hypothetical protein [Treponema sp.]
MVQTLFFLRFRSQLRRTRPELAAALEGSFTQAVSAAGGRFQGGKRVVSAFFDENRIGFWLDMVMFLEGLLGSLEQAGPELSGHALILGPEVPQEETERFCRELAKSGVWKHTGIWCAREFRNRLEPFARFDNIQGKYQELASIGVSGLQGEKFPYRERIERALAQGKEKNTLLLGPEFMGKRDGLYRYCTFLTGGIPPLLIRFGPSGGLACFADALRPGIRDFLSGALKEASPAGGTRLFQGGGSLEELESLGSILFKERLREEISFSAAAAGRCFLQILLQAYYVAAGNRRAVIILEDLPAGMGNAAALFRDVWSALENRDRFLIFGICQVPAGDAGVSGEGFKDWGGVFPRILKFTSDDFPVRNQITMPSCLWETSYSIFLLGLFFPPWLLPRLFEEEGLNPKLPEKALELLLQWGVIDSPGDPRPRVRDFMSLAEKALGDRKDAVRSFVRNRLLAWVNSNRLNPCLRLLKVLSDLGGKGDDALVLRALRGDIGNGTCKGIEDALAGGYFDRLAGADNAPSLRWVYLTLSALVHGTEQEIREAFDNPAPSGPDGLFPALQAQIQANLAIFYLGKGEGGAARERVKQAMLLNQPAKDGAIPAYRLFSLVSLSQERLDDAIEYITFAMEQSEKAREFEELAKAAYFAAGIHFLYGNLSKAERLAFKAESAALDLGRPEWADKARFLKGRFRFEAGAYGEALEIFESLAGNAAGEKERTIRAWVYRARVFLKASGFAASIRTLRKPDSPNYDALLFMAEAAFLAGDYQEAASLAEALLGLPGESGNGGGDFLFTEQPDWQNGFAQCETILVPARLLKPRLALVYLAMARGRLALPGDPGGGLVKRMQRLTREELLSDGDPYDVFCYYGYYRLLQGTGADRVDMGTVVSMAFKRLQRRASRIDDSKTRQDYISLNRWNNALSLAAKEYKLI